MMSEAAEQVPVPGEGTELTSINIELEDQPSKSKTPTSKDLKNPVSLPTSHIGFVNDLPSGAYNTFYFVSSFHSNHTNPSNILRFLSYMWRVMRFYCGAGSTRRLEHPIPKMEESISYTNHVLRKMSSSLCGLSLD